MRSWSPAPRLSLLHPAQFAAPRLGGTALRHRRSGVPAEALHVTDTRIHVVAACCTGFGC